MEIIEVRRPGEKKGPRALLLFSGGLDSVLAGKVLEEQGIEIVGVTFRSQFFGAEGAIKAAQELGWPLLVVDISREQIRIVEQPKYGFGRNMNPCLDCHGQMARIAGGLLGKYQADFVATGEVVGERPMSQNRQALSIVEKLSGIKGLVLRPLSAKLLAVTLPEEKGLVDREKLLDIFGRSRKRQLELAEKYGIKEYPTPSGGCLLTDPGFSVKLKELLKWRGKLLAEDIDLILSGRVFFEKEGLIVIGRNEQENENILRKALGWDVVITTAKIKGPLTVVRLKETVRKEAVSDGYVEEKDYGQGKRSSDLSRVGLLFQESRKGAEENDDLEKLLALQVIKKACLLTIRYSKARSQQQAEVAILWQGKSNRKEFLRVEWEKYL